MLNCKESKQKKYTVAEAKTRIYIELEKKKKHDTPLYYKLLYTLLCFCFVGLLFNPFNKNVKKW